MSNWAERVNIKLFGILALILLTSAIGAVLEGLHYAWEGLNRLMPRRR